jgi:hypothetical protein
VVNVSKETPEQTDARLKRVIRQCRVKVFAGAFAFEEFPLADFPSKADSNALALVRDDAVWSQLVESNRADAERFAVWRFHFPADVDNSGFVGWLASHLKNRFGTGVFVVCGQNNADGGIFDYWGCPLALKDAIIGEVHTLMNS